MSDTFTDWRKSAFFTHVVVTFSDNLLRQIIVGIEDQKVYILGEAEPRWRIIRGKLLPVSNAPLARAFFKIPISYKPTGLLLGTDGNTVPVMVDPVDHTCWVPCMASYCISSLLLVGVMHHDQFVYIRNIMVDPDIYDYVHLLHL